MSPVIAVKDIAYVRYQAPDLEVMERCLLDFGLHRVQRTAEALYMRASCSEPFVHVTQRGSASSVGFGLVAGSEDDLQRLAAEAGTRVVAIDEPGGGQCVTLTDPAGLRVDVVHGRRLLEALPVRSAFARNIPGKPARINRPVRTESSPSQVLRAGHVALLVPDFDAAYDFYTRLLGMRLSDAYQAGPEGPLVAAFLHCGLGDTAVDHHTVALVSPPGLPSGRIDHSAFEVTDLDDLMRGHEHMRARGHRHSWGLGRHVEGSQLFDYWRDPYGHKIEHWTDGDMVNDQYVPNRVPMDPGRLAQWAPPINAEFFE